MKPFHSNTEMPWSQPNAVSPFEDSRDSEHISDLGHCALRRWTLLSYSYGTANHGLLSYLICQASNHNLHRVTALTELTDLESSRHIYLVRNESIRGRQLAVFKCNLSAALVQKTAFSRGMCGRLREYIYLCILGE